MSTRGPERYDAVGFDLLTALLDTWSLWAAVAGGREAGMRWHAASQARLRGTPYRSFDVIVREAAGDAGIPPDAAAVLLARWDAFAPWPDVPPVLTRLATLTTFVVTNCSIELGRRAAARAGTFDLVVTAEEAGAYKPDPRPYRLALDRLGLDPSRTLFVAGSAHDVGGATRAGMAVYWANRGDAPRPADATALVEAPDFARLAELAGR